jgi:UBA-like domain
MDPQAEFLAITGATVDEARFYLQASQGDLSAAIDQYYTSGGQAIEESAVAKELDAPEEGPLPVTSAPAPGEHIPPSFKVESFSREERKGNIPHQG